MKKIMKTTLVTVLALVIAFAFACGKDSTKTDDTPKATEIVASKTDEPVISDAPTEKPTDAPTAAPTEKPTQVPDVEPTTVPEGLPVADIFSASFTSKGMSDVSANAYEVTECNDPITVYDSALGRYVMSCDGDIDQYAYQVFGFKDNYATLEQSGFSVELYAMYAYNDREMFAFSNLHAGGFSVGVAEADEEMSVLFEDGGSYAQLFFGTTEADKYYHYVLTYDGTTLKLYLNGEKTAEQTIGNYYFTKNAGASYLCVGADSSEPRTNEYFWDGTIAKANIYSGALTADQVALLYANK